MPPPPRPALLAFGDAPITDLRTGATAPLSSLWAPGAGPVAITFLRRLG